ncbi:Chaperonin Cpn60 [Artemisia annua]|uniref:Chaperonin Cpn60 n=1 Tax=Artemisia annua TaxID=35608 RepID=A0A2U1P8E0_ARTAN|nr:Chaperonin Cpn60 [Artemisia annua]
MATYVAVCEARMEAHIKLEKYPRIRIKIQEDQFREEQRRLGEWEQPNDGVSFAMSMPPICHNSVEDTRTTIVPFEAERYTWCRPVVLDIDAKKVVNKNTESNSKFSPLETRPMALDEAECAKYMASTKKRYAQAANEREYAYWQTHTQYPRVYQGYFRKDNKKFAFVVKKPSSRYKEPIECKMLRQHLIRRSLLRSCLDDFVKETRFEVMGAKVGTQESKATKSNAYTKHNKRMSRIKFVKDHFHGTVGAFRLPVNAVDAKVASDSFVGALLSEFFADQSVFLAFRPEDNSRYGTGPASIFHVCYFYNLLFSIHSGTVIREEVGLTLKNAGSDVLGLAAKVVLTKDTTTIVGDGSTQELINKWVAQIRNLIEVKFHKTLFHIHFELGLFSPFNNDNNFNIILQATEHDYEKEKLNERIAKLFGGVAVIQLLLFCSIGDCLNKEEHILSSLAGSSSMNQPTSLTVLATRCNFLADPDMLEVGNAYMTYLEYPSHYSIWAFNEDGV